MDEAQNEPKHVTRRRFVGGAAVLGAGVFLWSAPRLVRRPDPLAFNEVEGLPPFRRLVKDGDVSSGVGDAGSAILIGLDAGAPKADPEILAAVRADPCAALFQGAEEGSAVPVAYFSDVRCPWCRIMEERLDALGVMQDPGIAFVEHELPVFGPPSEAAARAILAAPDPESAAALRERLRHTPGLTDTAYIRDLASRLGLDSDALLARMGAAFVRDRLARSRAAARLLGFLGTPGLVIGHTVVSGAVPTETLARIIEDERLRGPAVCG